MPFSLVVRRSAILVLPEQGVHWTTACCKPSTTPVLTSFSKCSRDSNVECISIRAGGIRQVLDESTATGAAVAGRGSFEPAGGWGGDHRDGVPRNASVVPCS
jgi:hypothetical protein